MRQFLVFAISQNQPQMCNNNYHGTVAEKEEENTETHTHTNTHTEIQLINAAFKTIRKKT